MASSISFKINGKPYQITPETVPLETSLNSFIRNNAHLPGTKFMCLEGGCGACIVTLRGIHPVTKQLKSWAVNSCLTPVFSCHGLEIVTVEGIGNRKDGYHEVQKRLFKFNGTQCGYCSPGMVMNMYSLLEANGGKVSMADVENSFGGNICRCTGYRPILDAFKSFAYDADPKLLEVCKKIDDIEDLPKFCSKLKSNRQNYPKNDPDLIKLSFKNNQRWFKVYDIKTIFDIFDNCPTKPYMLVAGNTAHGVYRRSDNIALFIDITGIKDLQAFGYTGSKKLMIGANVSLTDLIAKCRSTSTTPGYEYLNHLADHVEKIANVPVRNAGTIAGNLSIKQMKNEFPSDLFIILESVNAKLTVAKSKNNTIRIGLLEYLKLDMNQKVILNIILQPLDPKCFTYRSYKIMPRAENVHAYVNAGFLIEFKHDKVASARICYGGISSHFTHATKTEQFLCGKQFYCTATLQEVIKILDSELNPDWILPDASPKYRKEMAIALFYKFMINTCPNKDRINPKYISGGAILERSLSSGTQTFDTYEDKWPISQFVPKYEGLHQTTGEIEYSNDIPHQVGELWAAFVPATQIHAKVLKIDPSRALKVPGVRYFFSAQDIPGQNNFMSAMPFEVEEIFLSADERVKFNGQPVGIILADTLELANYAVKSVTLTYDNSNKTIITTLHEAYKQNAKDRFTYHEEYSVKATRKGENTTKNIKGKFEMGNQYHFSMETQTTVCVPSEDGIKIYCATQWVDFCQVAVANALGIPNNNIDMVFKRCGGAYGSKITRPSQIACACALACHLTHRPVRFVMTLESNMSVIGKRPSVISVYDIDVDDDGIIQRLHNNYIEESGCSPNENPSVDATPFSRNCYISDTFNIDAQSVITDTASHTWCRGPGSTEGIAMTEQMMEHIARATGKDPIDVRLSNMPENHALRTIMKDFIKQTDFYERKKDINDFNIANRWIKRGIAMIPMQYHQMYSGAIPAYVAIYQGDGTVIISHGGIEIGQGIHTKIAQVAAYVLGISLDIIKIKQCDNVIGANSGGTGSSMTSEAVCYAVKKACQELMDRIQPVRDEMPNASWKEVIQTCYNRLITLSTTYTFKETELTPYYTYGVTCAEVEVDVLTGNLQLRRVDILEDTGESLSPSVDIGQIEGAFIMGIGYWLTEQMIYGTDNGELLTDRTWTYHPPGAKDIPIDFRVTFLQKSTNELGVLGSKATGEPPLCMSVVVLFALRHALDSARKDAGCENVWFELDGPATPETIYLAASNSIDSFIL